VTALMCAAHDAGKVAMLIEAGADVKAATTGGYTALHVAAAYDGAEDSVRLLLKNGADPNARGRGLFVSPLARAALRGDRAGPPSSLIRWRWHKWGTATSSRQH